MIARTALSPGAAVATAPARVPRTAPAILSARTGSDRRGCLGGLVSNIGRMEQAGKFVSRTGRTGRRHAQVMESPLHRLPSPTEDLWVVIPRRDRSLLFQ